MALQSSLQRDVLEYRMEDQIDYLAKDLFGKKTEDCSDKELYYVLLELTKCFLGATARISGDKKVYYISFK